jgi:sulfonate transport system ATP-binding protein
VPSAETSHATALGVTIRAVGRTFPAENRDAAAREVLRDITLEIQPGEIVSLLGPSGCGKSTLLRQVSGLDFPTTGTVDIDGAPVLDVDQRCAVAFQEPRMLPWRSIAHNVELGAPARLARAQKQTRVAELLDLVQLTAAADLRPRQISGGMAQRASLARALARNPGVLLLDEPFGALDALTRLTMQDLLLEIHASEPATVLLVTHDVDEALYLSDRVVLLGKEPGASADSGSGIRTIVSVPGSRPRDRGDADLAQLRAELLDGLGVASHHLPVPTP